MTTPLEQADFTAVDEAVDAILSHKFVGPGSPERDRFRAVFLAGRECGVEESRQSLTAFRKEIMAPQPGPLDPGIGPASVGASKVLIQALRRLRELKTRLPSKLPPGLFWIRP